MTAAQLHLGVGLNGAGWHPAAASEGRPDTTSAQFWIDSVAEAERGLLEFVTIDDVVADAPAPRLDAVLLASRVAAQISHIGVVPSVDVTHADPFHVAQAIATLDAVSAGRAGIHLRNVPHDAASYAASLHAVWDELASAAPSTARHLVDADTLHYIAFVGERFSVLGPAATPTPPKGRPVVLVSSPTAADESLVGVRDLVVFLDITASAARARRHHLDDVARRPVEPGAETFVGTPGQLADLLLDGPQDTYRLLPASTSIDLPLITRRLTPELQLRGVLGDAYADTTLAAALGADRARTDGLRAAG
ncbi:MAG TPA: LLM class flavin-dependent oxidoreductase [Jatrophihabitantaceae bacterium]|jgi:alkanesulfonate monooxygenase SsuD/methylene tetrahydromethanopterin reductase-like flavin-dependent oxidoreductase (luciferase family)